jgi:hypothetical protein
MQLKTKSKELQKIWPILCDVFDKSRNLTNKDFKALEKLGYRVKYEGKHPKLYIDKNMKTYVITLSSSPSDNQWGRQVLRMIRRIYENE